MTTTTAHVGPGRRWNIWLRFALAILTLFMGTIGWLVFPVSSIASDAVAVVLGLIVIYAAFRQNGMHQAYRVITGIGGVLYTIGMGSWLLVAIENAANPINVTGVLAVIGGPMVFVGWLVTCRQKGTEPAGRAGVGATHE